MRTITNNWNSKEGKKIIDFLIKERNQENPKTYKDIAKVVNDKYTLNRPVTDEDLKHLFRRKKKKYFEENNIEEIQHDRRRYRTSSFSDVLHRAINSYRWTRIVDSNDFEIKQNDHEILLYLPKFNVLNETTPLFEEEVDNYLDQLIMHAFSKEASKPSELHLLFITNEEEQVNKTIKDYKNEVVVQKILNKAELLSDRLMELHESFDTIKVTGVMYKYHNHNHIDFDSLFYKIAEKMLSNYADNLIFDIKNYDVKI